MSIYCLTLCMLCIFSCLSHLLTFFQNQPFQQNGSGTQSGCQTVWIQTVVLSLLIWVQIACKD